MSNCTLQKIMGFDYLYMHHSSNSMDVIIYAPAVTFYLESTEGQSRFMLWSRFILLTLQKARVARQFD